MIGVDVRTLKDPTGKAFGLELYAARTRIERRPPAGQLRQAIVESYKTGISIKGQGWKNDMSAFNSPLHQRVRVDPKIPL
jgi:hypothetical protein